MTDIPVSPKEAVDRINAARKAASLAHDKLQAEDERNRSSYEGLYAQLVVVSGGTVALSITYLGYLETAHVTISAPKLLVSSWVALLVCLLLSVFASFFYAFYRHYSRLSDYTNEASIKYHEEAVGLPLIPQLPPLTSDEVVAQQKDLRQLAESRRKDSDWVKRRADFYWFIWRWGGFAARTAIVVGITCLVGFAIFNLHGPVQGVPLKKP